VDSVTQSWQVPSLSQPLFLLDLEIPLPGNLQPASTISSGLPLSRMINLGFFQSFFVADITPVTPDRWLQDIIE
jgi:hypothetical protein